MDAKKPDARRLVQIARRKLEALGICCEVVDGGSLLLGTLPDEGTPIVNPLSAQPLHGIRFYVEGHDTLHLTDPPALAGVPALEFYSLPDGRSLRRSIISLVERRAASIGALRDRLRKLGFELKQLDRLASVRAILDLELVGTVTVEADEDGVRLVECTSVGGDRPVSAGGRSLDLDQFSDASDVELFLTPIVEKALQENAPAPSSRAALSPRTAASGDHRPRVEARPAPRGGVNLGWLLDSVGPEFFARGRVTLSRELGVDNQPGRLDLDFRDRATISGQVVVGDEVRWKGSFPPAQLRTLESFLARSLQRAAKRAEPAAEVAGTPDTGGLIPPMPREIWVMDVQVEDESSEEVRYLGLHASGGRQGAPRVLPRRTFEKVFVPHGAGHRMLVRVVAVTEAHVTYQRLNSDRRPAAAPREVPIAAFLAAFVAEAAAF
jgi:hypothetical protein